MNLKVCGTRVAKAHHSTPDPEDSMRNLIDWETADRSVRAMYYRKGAARFPVHGDLAAFDFPASRADETLVRELHGAAFSETARNIVLIGGPGTGKTDLATTIGIEALRAHGRRVQLFCTVEP